MVVRKLHQKRGWAFAICVAVVKPSLMLLTRRQYIDGEKLPARGGAIVVANHISHLDPLTLALYLYDHGRIVRFMAKEEILEAPVIGPIAKSAKQIPVKRLSTDAAGAYSAAVEAVREGECVMFYPEGTITRDPGLWPMTGKTGAARVALATGAPVVPVAQWGVEEILPPYGKPKLFPRKTVRVKVGDPVDLSEFSGLPLTKEVLHAATDRIMETITALVADLRGEPAPTERFDPRAKGVAQTGNPNKPPKSRKARARGLRRR